MILESKDRKEWVAITDEAMLQIDGKEVAGHIVITLDWNGRSLYLVKAVHLADAKTMKPLLDAFYRDYPELRPKKTR